MKAVRVNLVTRDVEHEPSVPNVHKLFTIYLRFTLANIIVSYLYISINNNHVISTCAYIAYKLVVFCMITPAPTYSIISYANIVFDLHLFDLPPIFQECKQRVRQALMYLKMISNKSNKRVTNMFDIYRYGYISISTGKHAAVNSSIQTNGSLSHLVVLQM